MAWSCDSSAKAAVSDLSEFIVDQTPSGMGQGFDIQGKSLGYSDRTCFVGTTSTVVVADQGAAARAEWWEYLEGVTPEGTYFCDTIQVKAITSTHALLMV